jgi:7-cyano-7-deazaguanine synthase in queuosine biosynthesis
MERKDYSQYLVLYSGGADSTHFIESEPTAKHLLFYEGRNKEQLKVAVTNANLLNRYITISKGGDHPSRDGETNHIHSLYDTHMALDASIIAVSHGMKGIVMCFNADDIGINAEAINEIMRKAEPNFELLQPLREVKALEIRNKLKSSRLKTVSCMNGNECGYCAKCLKEY